MELRVLEYFLETARESNMSRAAERLHISQPTMSKQIKELEEELGAKLFTRSNYNIKLTEAGMLLRERAEDIISLVEKTKAEFKSLDDLNSGDIFVGSAESESVSYFTGVMKELQSRYPRICCNFYSGNMEDVCEKLDKGLLDFAIVMSFVDLSKYNYLEIPAADTWGVLMRKDDTLAERQTLSVDDLIGLPLICSRQWLDQDFPHWFGNKVDDVHVVATFNLAFNASVMVRTGMGYAISYDKLTDTSNESDLTFKPLRSVPKSQMYIIWRKYQTFTPSAKLLLRELQAAFGNQANR